MSTRPGYLSYISWFFVFFAGFGLVVPQLSPYIYSTLKLESPGIIFLAGQLALPLGSLLSGYLSDKTLRLRSIQLGSTLLAAVSIAAFSLPAWLGWAASKGYYLLGWAGFCFSLGGILPLANVSYMQSGLPPEKFGVVRLFGTLAFFIINGILIVIKARPEALLFLSSFLFILSAAFLFLLPAKRQSSGQPFQASAIGRLLGTPLFLFFLFIMLLSFIQFGPSEYVIGDIVSKIEFAFEPVPFSWMLGTATEIIFFAASPWLIRRVSPSILLAMGFIIGVLRYGGMLLFAGDEMLIYLQSLHGLHFAPAFLGSLLLLEQKVDARYLATAQALYLVLARALGTGIGAFVLGDLTAAGLFDAAWYIAIAVATCGFALVFIFSKKQKGRYFLKEAT